MKEGIRKKRMRKIQRTRSEESPGKKKYDRGEVKKKK